MAVTPESERRRIEKSFEVFSVSAEHRALILEALDSGEWDWFRDCDGCTAVSELHWPTQGSEDGAGDGNRTRVTSLEGWSFTTKQHPRTMTRRLHANGKHATRSNGAVNRKLTRPIIASACRHNHGAVFPCSSFVVVLVLVLDRPHVEDDDEGRER